MKTTLPPHVRGIRQPLMGSRCIQQSLLSATRLGQCICVQGCWQGALSVLRLGRLGWEGQAVMHTCLPNSYNARFHSLPFGFFSGHKSRPHKTPLLYSKLSVPENNVIKQFTLPLNTRDSSWMTDGDGYMTQAFSSTRSKRTLNSQFLRFERSRDTSSFLHPARGRAW